MPLAVEIRHGVDVEYFGVRLIAYLRQVFELGARDERPFQRFELKARILFLGCAGRHIRYLRFVPLVFQKVDIPRVEDEVVYFKVRYGGFEQNIRNELVALYFGICHRQPSLPLTAMQSSGRIESIGLTAAPLPCPRALTARRTYRAEHGALMNVLVLLFAESEIKRPLAGSQDRLSMYQWSL